MTFTITITHIPSSRFGVDEPETLSEPRLFGGFRARTGRGSFSHFGGVPQVVVYDPYRHAAPASWTSRESAERNLARLTDRGYVAHVTTQGDRP